VNGRASGGRSGPVGSPPPLKRFCLLLLLGAAGSSLLLRATAGAIVERFLDEAVGGLLAVPFRRGEVRFDPLQPSIKVSPLVILQEEGGEELLRVDSARALLKVGGLSPRLAGLILQGPEVRIRPGMRNPFRMGGLGGPGGAGEDLRLLVREGRLLWEKGPEGARRLEDLHLDLVSSGGGPLAGEGSASFPGGTVSASVRLGRAGVLLDGILRFRSEASGWLGSIDPQGPVTVSLRLGEGSPPRASAAPQAVTVRIPGTDTRVEGITGTLGVEGEVARFDLAGTWRGGTVGGRGIVRREGGVSLEADVAASGLVLDEAVRPLAALDRTALEVLEGLAPRGRVDLRGRILHRGGAWDGALEALVRELELRCEGFLDRRKGRVYGFPYPVRITRGSANLRPGRAWLHGFSGSMGKASFSLDAELYGEAPPGLEVELRAEALPLDRDVRQALAALEGGAKIFDDFAPEGSADVRVRFAHPPRTGALRYEATIEPRRASARWAPFPLRVRDLSGRIVLEEDLVRFDVAGAACGGRVRVEGQLLGSRSAEAPAPALLLRVTGEDLEIDEELRAAVSKVLADDPSMDPIGLRGGRLDFEATAWRRRGAPEGEFGLVVRGLVEGSTFLLPVEGVRAEGVAGGLTVERRGDRTVIRADALRGEVLGSTVFASLARRDSPAGDEFALEVHAPRVSIDPAVQAVCSRLLGLPWLDPKSFEAAGTLDLQLDWRSPSSSPSPSARLRFRDVSLRGRDVPFAVDGIDGAIHVDAGGVRRTEEGLAFRIAGAPAWVGPLSLRIEEGRPIGSFVLHATGLPFPVALDRALPPQVALPLRALRLSGTVDLEGVTVEVRPGEGDGLSLEARGDVAVHSSSLDPGVPIGDVEGRVRLEPLVVGPGGFSLDAKISAERARLLGLLVRDLRVSLQARPGRLSFSGLEGKLGGGNLRAREGKEPLTVLTGEPPSFSTSLALDGSDVRVLLADLLPRVGNLSGTLDARLDLEGAPGDLGSFRGEGRVRIEDGALGEIPVFREVFALLDDLFEIGRAPEFREGEARFEIGGRRIRFRQIDLRSDVLEILGLEDRGELSFEGDVDLLFEARVFPQIPVVRPLYDLLREVLPRIWRVRVEGALASPDVRLETANPEINQLLGLTEPKRRRTWLPPVPDPLAREGLPRF
jgi:hypothetical protein